MQDLFYTFIFMLLRSIHITLHFTPIPKYRSLNKFLAINLFHCKPTVNIYRVSILFID